MNDRIILLSEGQLRDLIKQSLNEVLVEKEKNNKQKDLLNAEEVCSWLGISKSALNNWKASAKIPFKRLGKRVFFVKEDILNALEDSHYSKIKQLRG